MTETPSDVVSGATEAPVSQEPSSPDTQTSGQQPDTEVSSDAPATEQKAPTTQEKKDYRQLLRDDPDFNAFHQSELKKALNRIERQRLRATAKSATDNEDADAALHVARQIAAEQDEPDEGEAQSAAWMTAANRVQPQLERLLQLDKDGRATNPYYVRLHQQIGRAEMDKKYAEDPVAFVGWVDDQIMEMRVDEKLKKVAPALARGMASDEVHKQLRGMGTPLTGGANGAGALTPDRYYSDPDLRKKLQSTAEGRKQIDDMMARAARS